MLSLCHKSDITEEINTQLRASDLDFLPFKIIKMLVWRCVDYCAAGFTTAVSRASVNKESTETNLFFSIYQKKDSRSKIPVC